jgi:hypothetical protein
MYDAFQVRAGGNNSSGHKTPALVPEDKPHPYESLFNRPEAISRSDARQHAAIGDACLSALAHVRDREVAGGRRREKKYEERYGQHLDKLTDPQIVAKVKEHDGIDR